MSYRELAPAPALRDHVDCLWSLTVGPGDRPARVLPDGAMDVLMRRDGDRVEVHVIGTMTRAQQVATRPGEVFVGVRFRPGEAAGWLGVAAHELRDGRAELGAVWGPPGRELGRRLEEAGDVDGCRRLLERALLERAAGVRADRRVRAAVRAIEASAGRLGVRELSAGVGLSERSVERLFQERVGVGPKVLARVVRLQRLLGGLGAGGWAAAAARAGYADQAHLAREVQALCGVTPGQLRRERAGG